MSTRPVSPAGTDVVLNVPAAAETAVARIVSDKERARTIELEWPVEFEGVVYDTVTIRRLTTKEVVDFLATIDGQAQVRWPMYDVPDAVLDALDDDDSFLLDEVVKGFLPRRFQA